MNPILSSLFDFPIAQVVETPDVIIVILNTGTSDQILLQDNVFGVSPDGQILWQIEKSPFSSDPSNYYVEVARVEGETATLWHYACSFVSINIKTGKILTITESR